MKIKTKIVSISAVLLISLLTASNAQAGWVWLQTRHAINIRTNANFIGFQSVESVQNPANCPSHDFYAVPTANDSKSALAVLLAANLAGKTVSIFIADNLCEANSGRPVVTDVQ